MKIAVTGASGHIGINLIPELIKAGYQLRILSHRNEEVLKKFNVPLIRGDLLDTNSLNELIDGADTIIHLAAIITIHKRSPEAIKVNVQGTKNILEAAQKSKVRKFIYFSSIHSLDASPPDQVLDENRAYNIQSPFDYDRSKIVGEQIVLDSNTANFETLVLNPTSVVGPFDYRPSLMGRAIIQLYKGKIPALLKGGYDWVDVRDVVSSTLASLNRPLHRQKLILAGGWHSITELGEAVAKFGGKPCPKLLVPFWVAYLGANVMSMIPFIQKEKQLFTAASLDTLQNGHKNISFEKAHRMLGHRSRPFEETIRDTVQWFKEIKILD